jgi:hypothetical protein
MTRRRVAAKMAQVAQAWVEPVTDDPEAVSALEVARAHLPAGRALRSLRRVRLFELCGALPGREEFETLLHRSIQFYNPHKERCLVRFAADEQAPLRAGECAVLVFDRGEERRAGAERWWRHETGTAIEVREGVAWLLGFDPGVGGSAGSLEELTVLRDRRHGLLCNPHAQDHRFANAVIPLPWMTATA